MGGSRLKQAVRGVLVHLPGGPEILKAYERRLYRAGVERLGSPREIFTHYYHANAWQDGESVSGAGSTVAYTEKLRKGLAEIIPALGVRHILDAPCGDYNWFRLVERDGIAYTGGDIVEALVARNQERFGGPGTEFRVIDIVHDPLPAADLWMCRDVLFHFSYRDAFLALDNFLASGIRYLLTTSHTACTRNEDIPTGGFREINLLLPPFSLPAPARAIDDWIEGFPPRCMGLWERDVVAAALAANPARARILGRGAPPVPGR